MSRPDLVALMCNSIDDISPKSGGAYGRQLAIELSMGAVQRRAAIIDLLGDMPSGEGLAIVYSQWPELQSVNRAPPAGMLYELQAAHALIEMMLGVMSASQHAHLAVASERVGLGVDGATRHHERAAVIAAALKDTSP